MTRRTTRACLHASPACRVAEALLGRPPARETSTKGSLMRARPRGPRDAGGLTRRALLARGAAAGAGAAAASAVGAPAALAGHTPPPPTPDRPPPSSDLVTYEEVTLAFRCHGMHLEALRFPITPLGQHYVLMHFDVPYFAATDAYSFTITGRVRTPMTVTLGQLKARPTVRQPTIMECAGVGRSYAHPGRSTSRGSTSRWASTS